jgi:hypothetical protein
VASRELDVLNQNDATSAFGVLAQAQEIQQKVEKMADEEEEDYRKTHGLPSLKPKKTVQLPKKVESKLKLTVKVPKQKKIEKTAEQKAKEEEEKESKEEDNSKAKA